MGKRLLPPIGSLQEEGIKRDYQSAPIEKMHDWARLYGFANTQSFRRSVLHNYKLGRTCKVVPEEKLIVNLPNIRLREYIPPTSNGDEEEIIFIAGDGHAGKITRSFNKEIYRQ